VSFWTAPLRRALDEAPSPVSFFVRDDDVGWRNDRLRALIAVFRRHAVPIDFAVIPRLLRPAIARELVAAAWLDPELLGFHQHGFAHANHEPEARPSEFGPTRSPHDQLRDIAAGRTMLAEHLEGLADPIFTPPWNRCTHVTGECLVELGFEALSRESQAEPLGMSSLAELPVTVDWFAKRKRVPLGRAGVVGQLVDAVRAGGPVGLMLHHAITDDDELHAVDELVRLLARHPQARSVGMWALIPALRRLHETEEMLR
jgi:hypothetical protein